MQRTIHFTAILVAIAMCAAPTLGCRSVCVTDECESDCLAERRPLAGRLSMWKARCAEHFAEEPVAAPHSRFHPVPTRPVFSPPPEEELAALFTPAEASKPQAETEPKVSLETATTPRTAAPLDETPNSPDAATATDDDAIADDILESDVLDGESIENRAPAETLPPPEDVEGDEPTRTARRTGLRAAMPPTAGDEAGDEQDAAPVHTTFDPTGADAPPPGGSRMHAADAETPLLWRAVRTPVGSLRAFPANSTRDGRFPTSARFSF